MSLSGHEKPLLFTTAAVVIGILLVALVTDVESRSQHKDKPEESEKSQLPPIHKDMKLVHKNTLLHSVWVIISIVLMIILGVIIVYYWVLFYPILCKKERKYDVMQMSAKP